MNATFDFSGKQVFVFGGTSGINLGIARSFAGQPYSARMHSGGMIAAANEDVAERVKHRWEL